MVGELELELARSTRHEGVEWSGVGTYERLEPRGEIIMIVQIRQSARTILFKRRGWA